VCEGEKAGQGVRCDGEDFGGWAKSPPFPGFHGGSISLQPLVVTRCSIPRFQGDTSMPSRDEIFEKVKTALVDALGVDDDEVTSNATMVGDLGAESIDFLDIVFRLEKSFGIKIPRGELFPEDVLSSTEFVTNGKVNAAGMAALKARMPFYDLTKFEQNPSVQNFPNMLTVEDMVRYVQSKVGG
jgi:acyl carrier protein